MRHRLAHVLGKTAGEDDAELVVVKAFGAGRGDVVLDREQLEVVHIGRQIGGCVVEDDRLVLDCLLGWHSGVPVAHELARLLVPRVHPQRELRAVDGLRRTYDGDLCHFEAPGLGLSWIGGRHAGFDGSTEQLGPGGVPVVA